MAAVLAVVGAVWALPEMLDWSRFRDEIAALATERLGRPVRIGGGVSLQLLPQPVLTAHQVAVADTGDGLELRAEALRLSVSLPGLLAGTLRSSDLVLQGADLRLPWPLPPTLGHRSQTWFTGLHGRVVDSRLQVGGVALSGIDALLTTDADTSTLSVVGSATPGRAILPGDTSTIPRNTALPAGPTASPAASPGTPPSIPDMRAAEATRWQFTARLALPGSDGAAPLNVSLDGQAALRDTGGSFSGHIAADGTLAGHVSARGPDLSLLLPAPAQPWRMDGRFNASGSLAVADELSLTVGSVPARGALALRVAPVARLDVSIAASRLDLDAWAPALVQAAARPASIFGELPIGIDLSAEAATYAGGTIRALRGAADLPANAGGGVALRDVSATLPGDASFLLSGIVGGAGTRFEGSAALKAPDLRPTLAWAPWWPLPAAALPPGILRRFDGTARVAIDAGQLSLSELKGTLDGTSVAGTLALRRAARAGITADMQFGTLMLDPWIPGPDAEAADTWLPRLLASLRSVDADVKLGADAADWAGVPLGPMLIELGSDAARVALRRLAARPLGMRLTASGSVAADGRLIDGRLDLSTPDLGLLRPMLARVARPQSPWDRLLRGAGTLSMQAAGPPDALAGRLVAEGADLRLDLQPVVNMPARQASLSVALHHPGAPRLLDALGLQGTAAWLGDGSLSLVGRVAVDARRIEVLEGTLAAGSLRLSGRLGLAGRRLTGEVSAETLPLPLPYPRSPDPLPFGWLVGWSAALRLQAADVLFDQASVLRAASLDIGLDNGVLTLGLARAEALGGTLSGITTVDAAVAPPRVTAGLGARGLGIGGPLLDAPVDLVAGLADMTMEGMATGSSPAALLATTTAAGTATVTEGTLAGFDMPAVQDALTQPNPADAVGAIQAALRAGNTPVRRLEAGITVRQGELELAGTVQGAWGDGHLTGTLDLATAALNGRLLLRATQIDRPGPELGLRMGGSLGRAARSVDLSNLVGWLQQRQDR